MAIKYKNKINISAQPPLVVTSDKKMTTKDKKEVKKELHYKYREALTEEFFEEVNNAHKGIVPDFVEEGLDNGLMSPQEIVYLYKKRYGQIGPNMKKYIVMNVYARQLALDKAPMANEYMPEVADLILARICSGQSLQTICKEPNMPNINTVVKWFADDPVLKERYNLARVARVDALAEKMLHEAATPRMSVNAIQKSDGSTEFQTYDAINRTRIMVDVIKWYMSKMDHETWGNKEKGADGSNEIKISVVGGLPTTVTEEGKVVETKPQEVQIVVQGGAKKEFSEEPSEDSDDSFGEE